MFIEFFVNNIAKIINFELVQSRVIHHFLSSRFFVFDMHFEIQHYKYQHQQWYNKGLNQRNEELGAPFVESQRPDVDKDNREQTKEYVHNTQAVHHRIVGFYFFEVSIARFVREESGVKEFSNFKWQESRPSVDTAIWRLVFFPPFFKQWVISDRAMAAHNARE